MSFDFSSILIQHGFTRETYDFPSTIIGFDYDIQFALFDTNTCFDVDRSEIYRQWNNPDAFVHCDLVTINQDIDSALHFFHQRWATELRYQNPVREIIDVQIIKQLINIHVLTISTHNAMTLQFTIT